MQRFEQQEAASPAVVASVRVTGTSSIEVAGWLGKSTVQMYVSPAPPPPPWRRAPHRKRQNAGMELPRTHCLRSQLWFWRLTPVS